MAITDDGALRMLINFYRAFSVVSKIVVIWNNQKEKPPALSLAGAPVEFVMVKQVGPLNKFRAWPQITTDCVVYLELDELVSLEDLSFANDVWKTHYFNYLVGFTFAGRNHARVGHGDSQRIVYSDTLPTSAKPFYSMLLPTGLILHRKYLQQFEALPQAALDIAEASPGCEALLMNILVSRAIHAGPQVKLYYAFHLYNYYYLELQMKVLKAKTHIPVSDKFGAASARSKCLQELSSFFKSPLLDLRYSMRIFSKDSEVTYSFSIYQYIMNTTRNMMTNYCII
jgi:hypothetical protein